MLVRDGRGDDHGEPAERDGLEGHPGRQDRAPADAIGEDPGDRGDDDRHPRPRQRPQTGLERAVALDDLEELGEQEDRAEHPEVHEQRHEVRGGERRGSGRSAAGASGAPGAIPRPRRRRAAPIPATSAATICGLVQPWSLPLMTPHTRARSPALIRPRPGHVEPALGTVGLGQTERGQREHDQPDRHVEPEDPVPVEALGDGAADERADGDREAGDPAPGPERDGASLRRDGRGQDGQGQRRDDRAADALDRAGEDEDLGRRRQRRERRTADEDRHADEEDALATESVAEGGAGDEQDREGQGVGVDHPLEVLPARRRGRA